MANNFGTLQVGKSKDPCHRLSLNSLLTFLYSHRRRTLSLLPSLGPFFPPSSWLEKPSPLGGKPVFMPSSFSFAWDLTNDELSLLSLYPPPPRPPSSLSGNSGDAQILLFRSPLFTAKLQRRDRCWISQLAVDVARDQILFLRRLMSPDLQCSPWISDLS